MDLGWKTIFQTYSPLSGMVRVEEKDSVKRLVIEGFTQSRTPDKEGKTNGYWDLFDFRPDNDFSPQKALILGLGLGTIALIWSKLWPNLSIDAVEIDPVVADLTHTYLNLPKEPNIIIGDAASVVHTLAQSGSNYDLIAVDAYHGGDFDKRCETEEFLSDLTNISSTNGWVIFNRIYSDSEKLDQDNFMTKLRRHFTQITTKQPNLGLTSYNVIIFCKH